MIPSFAERRESWSSPPVDDIGYLDSKELLGLDDEALLDLARTAELNRYQGWRNWQGRWRDVLGLDDTYDKRVLDYGCGLGIEALQYAKRGNQVSLADISSSNVALAKRVLTLSGHPAHSLHLILPEAPYIVASQTFDVIHCSGVLHHIPEPAPVVEAMAAWLAPEGELRLMVYSDDAWRIATQTEPPTELKIEDYVEFDAYWQHWDAVGGYADWYSCQRLQERFGRWFRVRRCKKLTERGEYLGAVLVKK